MKILSYRDFSLLLEANESETLQKLIDSDSDKLAKLKQSVSDLRQVISRKEQQIRKSPDSKEMSDVTAHVVAATKQQEIAIIRLTDQIAATDRRIMDNKKKLAAVDSKAAAEREKEQPKEEEPS